MRRHIVTFACAFALFLAALTPFAARPGSAAAKDVWLKSQSAHFTLIGDASAKEIRKAGMRLEQFHEAFSQISPRIFSPSAINSSVPITVVVFKNDLAYRPFKPLHQGKPAVVSGHFQSSGDIAYIALAAGRSATNPYAVIFHEYVHALTSGVSLSTPLPTPLPTWISEGLAEYFSSLEVTGGGKRGRLGGAIASHAKTLSERPLIPLETLTAADQASPFYTETDKKSLFYAESWALTHYLLRADGRRSQFRQFIDSLAQGKPADLSFKQAFQTGYATIEQELKNYIAQGAYPAEDVTFTQQPGIQLGMRAEAPTTPLSEAEVQAYLGDMLWRIQRSVDGEEFLNRALSIDSSLAPAHQSLGTLRLRQNRYAEARRHLRLAIEAGSRDYLAHYYYAYAIHREQTGESKYVSDLPEESVKEMRAALKVALQLNPDFADTYKLLAFIDLIRGEELDVAVDLINRAISLAPHREDIVYTLAQIQFKRKDYAAARQTALTLAGAAANPDVRDRASSMLENIAKIEERSAKMKDDGAARGDGADQSSPPPPPGQRFQGDQVRGLLTSIDCDDAGVTLTVKNESRSFKFRTTRLSQLTLVRYTPDVPTSIICGAINPARPVIVTYRSLARSGVPGSDGEPIGVEFMKPDGK
jgi:tetratricopeptide (TPR) repeat protein